MRIRPVAGAITHSNFGKMASMTSALSFSTRGLSRRHIINKATSKKTIIPVAKYLNGAKVSASFGLGLAK